MPFINDRLDQNQRQFEQSSPLPTSASGYKSRFTFDPDAVVELLKRKIAGQRSVIDALGAQLRVVKADICEPGRPLYVTLFIGDTGVGKTEIVRLLANAIHGSPDSFCRIDMNTLSQSHYSAAITGAPPGYVGSKEGVTLFNEDLIAGSYGRPGIVLFDEIEKASNDVARALMNILDTGKLKLASGNRELDFSNSLIFMTSNVGSRAWVDLQREARGPWIKRLKNHLKPVHHSRAALIEDALHERFDPEFLNRIDRIELFEPLTTEHLETIITLELERTNRTLKRKGVEAQLDPAAVALLRARGFDPEFGARSIRRSFRELVVLPLASALLANPPVNAATSRLSLFRGQVSGEAIQFHPVAASQAKANNASESLSARDAPPTSSQNISSHTQPSPERAGQEMKP